MASRIKGITIEIDGDVTGLDQALRSVNSQTNTLQQELRDVERLLKFDPGNTEAIAQRQQILGRQVEATTRKLEQLKDAQSQVQAQFDRGEINEQQYRAFRREIEFTEAQLEGYQRQLAQTDDIQDNLGESTNSLASHFKMSGKEMMGVGAGMVAFGAAGIVAFGGLVKAGADWQVRQNAITTMLGDQEDAVRTWSVANAKAYGLTNTQLTEAVAKNTMLAEKMGLTGTAATDMGKKIAITTMDLATFYDVPVEEMQDKFSSALNGSTEVLDQYGVDLSVATLEQSDYVKALGKTWNQMSEAEKKQARYNAIVEQTSKIQGNAKKEASSFSVQIGLLKTSLEETAGRIGDALIPKLEPLIAKVAQVVDMIAGWVEKNPELASTIAMIAAGMSAAIVVIGILVIAIGALSIAAGALNIALLPFTGIILAIIAVIGLLIAIGIYLYKNWDTIIAKAKEFKNKIIQAFEEWKQGVKDRMNKSVEDIKSIWNKVINFFKNIDLKQIGIDIIQGLLNGISSMAKKVWNKVKEIANGIGKTISNVLHMGSPSKVLIGLGEDAGEGLAIGLENTISQIDAMSKQMATAAIPDMKKTATDQVNQNNSKTFNVNIHSPKALDVRETNRLFNRTLNKMSLMW